MERRQSSSNSQPLFLERFVNHIFRRPPLADIPSPMYRQRASYAYPRLPHASGGFALPLGLPNRVMQPFHMDSSNMIPQFYSSKLAPPFKTTRKPKLRHLIFGKKKEQTQSNQEYANYFPNTQFQTYEHSLDDHGVHGQILFPKSPHFNGNNVGKALEHFSPDHSYDYDEQGDSSGEDDTDDTTQSYDDNTNHTEASNEYGGHDDQDDDQDQYETSQSKHKYRRKPPSTTTTTTMATPAVSSIYPRIPKPKNCSKLSFHYHMYIPKEKHPTSNGHTKKPTTTTTTTITPPLPVYIPATSGSNYQSNLSNHKISNENEGSYYQMVTSAPGSAYNHGHMVAGTLSPMDSDYYNKILLNKIFGGQGEGTSAPSVNYYTTPQASKQTTNYQNVKSYEGSQVFKMDDKTKLYVPVYPIDNEIPEKHKGNKKSKHNSKSNHKHKPSKESTMHERHHKVNT